LLALGALSGVEARNRNAHPFTGEHADKSVIFHEEGGMTSRAVGIADYFNKYSELETKHKYEPRKSGYTFAYNTMFGPTPEQQELEASLKANEQHKRLRSKQSFKIVEDRDNNELFLGSFFLSGATIYEGQALVDTATDLNVVMGFDQDADPTTDDNKDKFDIWRAIDERKGDISGRNTTIDYGSVQFTGAWAEGEIFLNQNGDGLESSKFEFLYAKSEKLLDGLYKTDENVDGIIGLARANKKVKLNTSSTPDTGRVSFLEIFDFAKGNET
jgi:hypothetical protein